jgi:hypothetical protein
MILSNVCQKIIFFTRFQFVALAALTFLAGCNVRVENDSPTVIETSSASQPDNLRERIAKVIDHTLNQRQLNSTDHAAWQVIHAVLAYGRDLKIMHEGELIPALDYLLSGNRINGWNARPGNHGVFVPLEAESKAGQGHPDQWLGYISQLDISADTPLVVWKKQYKLRDLLTQSQWDLVDGQEASWMLMALSNKSYWPDIDAKWKASNGNEWTADGVAALEADPDVSPIVGAACGGTHRLQGLALYVRRMRAEKGANAMNYPGFDAADKQVKFHIQRARELQNPDGSFSSNYFARAGQVVDMKDRIDTTGHVLEFLAMAADDETFNAPWVLRMCECLVTMMEKSVEAPLDCGGLYHTAHGLKVYSERRWGK